MEFSVIIPQSEDIFNEIRRKIKTLQNWGYDSGRKSLKIEGRNYNGANFTALKELAGHYPPDEIIAKRLWSTLKREEQLTACLLLPSFLNKEKIKPLASTCISAEIAEYFGSQYITHRDDIAEIVTDWLNSPETFLQIAALTGMAKHRILYGNKSKITPHFFFKSVNKIYPDKYTQLVAERFRYIFDE